MSQTYQFHNIIGKSEKILEIFEIIEKVARTDSTVIITGETGTGKELIARAIHKCSPRKDRPFVPINCAAIPEQLLESEFFGYEKGAFTGAMRSRMGRIEFSNQGTLFLDEISSMSLELQAKLLRVIQEQEFERIGGLKTIKVDFRLISATNQDLKEKIKEGTFREDLFYRLNVIPINVPPLRERKSDIPILVNHFLKDLREHNKTSVKRFSDKAMERLMQYHWPGNVRELKNLVERLSVLKQQGIIELDDIPSSMGISVIPQMKPLVDINIKKGISFHTQVAEFERRLLLEALEQTSWVKEKAAKLLKLKRTTLIEKMKRREIPLQMSR